ncbi:MAG: HAD family hydrolase [Planctomycetaceae bacterium]
MAKSLFEYADWLDERDLLWPQAPEPTAPRATPFLLPLADVRAVTWSVYGVLLLSLDGRLEPLVPDALRMEVALEKTIHEFHMWHSMSRKPGAPWEYMLQQYRRLIENEKLAGSRHKGEAPEVNLARVWRVLIERLQQKDYAWDEDLYGDLDEFSEKVAYYFHSCLQGMQAAPNALLALQSVREAGCEQGIIADGQAFTLVQLNRALRSQGDVPALNRLFTRGGVSLSYDIGCRQPAASLFKACLAGFAARGIAPGRVLYVASRLKEELAPARKLGIKTALFAGDKRSLQATPAQVQDPELRPDRILTDLRQIRQIVQPE